ncbi:MAG: TrkA family potassium uptake protein [Lachnospiraceae bacterium]|nr:TrkA family potassium uptake protein [Lachnospiraceae bacterium]
MKKEKKSIAVLGLGKYGQSLAETLYDMGEDVLVADINEKLIRDISGKVTSAVCADLSVEDEIEALGLQNMDVVYVCMGGNNAASILSVSIAKEKGVKTVIAKASSPRMEKILGRIGADKIINPEKEVGIRNARILASEHIRDFFEIDGKLCFVEYQPEKSWLDHDLVELNLRKMHNVNVVAIKKAHGKWDHIDPARKLKEEDLLMLVVKKEDMDKWR